MTSRYPAFIALVLLITSAILALVGISLLPIVAVSVLLWIVVIGRRWGLGLGLAAGLIGGAIIALVSLTVFPLVKVPVLEASVLLWGAIGVAAIAVHGRGAGRGARVRCGYALSRWAPPMLGPAVWTAGVLVARFSGTGSRYSWVMMGDSANNILFAREIVYGGGILVGASANPVPLPAAAIALAMSAGRSGVPVADLLRHDISAFALVWAILIALTCYLAGAAAAVVIDPTRRAAVVIASAGISLIPLSWFVTGYPIEYGFFNTHLALPIVFASWIAAISAARNPDIAFASLLGAATLMLAVWSPLVLIPLLLSVFVLVRHRSSLLSARGPRLAFLVLSVGQLIVYGFVVVLPGLLTQGGFLTGGGGIIPFPHALLFAVVGGGAITVVIAMNRKRVVAGQTLAVVIVAGSVGVGALLFLSRGQPSPWTYYPTKLSWLVAIVFIVLSLDTLIAAMPKMRILLFGVVAAALSIATFSVLHSIARTVPSYPWRDPLPRILTDDFPTGDAVAEQIFALSDPANPHLLWQSANPAEGTINFWLLQMRADSTSLHRDLRVYAYGHGNTPKDLCDIAEAMGPPVVVQTANEALASETASCGGAITVQVQAP